MWEIKKIVTLFALCLITTLSFTKNTASTTVLLNVPPTTEVSDCELPAPVNINTLSASSNTLTIGWTAVAGAVSYHAHVETNSTVIFDGIVPTNQLDLTNLSPSSVYLFSIKSVCSDGKISKEEGSYEGKTQGVIIEDFVMSVHGPTTPFVCQTVDLMEFDDQSAPFVARYKDSSIEKAFGIHYSEVHKCFALKYEAEKTWMFADVNRVTPQYPDVVPTDFVRVFHEGDNGNTETPVMEVHITEVNNQKFNICINILQPLYSIRRVAPETKVHGREQEAEKAFASTVSPNPCKDDFTLWLPEPSQSASTLRLFNINGNEVYSETMEPFTQSKNINIQQLIPGMYIARLESADGIQTFKLIKGQ